MLRGGVGGVLEGCWRGVGGCWGEREHYHLFKGVWVARTEYAGEGEKEGDKGETRDGEK